MSSFQWSTDEDNSRYYGKLSYNEDQEEDYLIDTKGIEITPDGEVYIAQYGLDGFILKE